MYVLVIPLIFHFFWGGGFMIGLVTLVGGTGLAIYLYFKSDKNTKKTIQESITKISLEPNSSGVIVSNEQTNS